MDFVMSNDPTTSKLRGFFRDFRSGPAAKGPVRSYTIALHGQSLYAVDRSIIKQMNAFWIRLLHCCTLLTVHIYIKQD